MSAYLCGPMTGCLNNNYPAFNEAAQRLRDAGRDIENPAENIPPECKTWGGWMQLALQQMLDCSSVIVLPGWEHSDGAALEIYVAKTVGKPVYFDEPLVQDLKPIRTDSIRYWLSQMLDGVVKTKFINKLLKG